MKEFFASAKTALKKPSVRFLALVIFFLLIFFVAKKRSPEELEYSSSRVERLDLIQSVEETGSLVSNLELRYGWEISGKVLEVLKKTGDQVKNGEVLARLDSAKQRARLNEGYAALSSAQAKLNLELAGPSAEAAKKSRATVDQAKAALQEVEAELDKVKASGETKISNAEKALETAKNNLSLVEGGEDSRLVKDAYLNLIDALKSSLTVFSDALIETDKILGIDNIQANDDYEDVLELDNTTVLNQTKTLYKSLHGTLRAFEFDILALKEQSTHALVDSWTLEMVLALENTQKLLSRMQLILADAEPGGDLSLSELNTLKTDISSAQASVNSSAKDLSAKKQAISTARTSLSSYRIAYDKATVELANLRKEVEADNNIAHAQALFKAAQLEEAEAGHEDLISDPRDVDLASLKAEVGRQAANVQALKDDLEKTELKALSDGILAGLDIEIGENAQANQSVAHILSSDLNIEVDISESDIVKVLAEDPVLISFDAYGEEVKFKGNVLFVEPAETEISGVIYYKTKIALDKNYPKEYELRSGMTANVRIITEEKQAVLAVSERSIIRREDGSSFVRVLMDAKSGIFEERSVLVGLSGDRGQTEIISGLNEGEEVVSFLKTE
ncbi:MAG: HlyD family efflux transporter periplasmic adaptor subunit [Candidatus Magasanikbacteria bacterium]|nr:HlyD family efflux transporter periplasmic adaptor subunit [Candidatus Magasanikbacteria bacterium]